VNLSNMHRLLIAIGFVGYIHGAEAWQYARPTARDMVSPYQIAQHFLLPLQPQAQQYYAPMPVPQPVVQPIIQPVVQQYQPQPQPQPQVVYVPQPQPAPQPIVYVVQAPTPAPAPIQVAKIEQPEETERDAYIKECMRYGFRKQKCVSIWDDEPIAEEPKPVAKSVIVIKHNDLKPKDEPAVVEKQQETVVKEQQETVVKEQQETVVKEQQKPEPVTTEDGVTITPLPSNGIEFHSLSKSGKDDLLDVDNAEYKAARERLQSDPNAIVGHITLR
jgi:hypothetical protein